MIFRIKISHSPLPNHNLPAPSNSTQNKNKHAKLKYLISLLLFGSDFETSDVWSFCKEINVIMWEWDIFFFTEFK